MHKARGPVKVLVSQANVTCQYSCKHEGYCYFLITVCEISEVFIHSSV